MQTVESYYFPFLLLRLGNTTGLLLYNFVYIYQIF